MSATIMQINSAEVRFGDCSGGPLTDFSCQVTSAEIQSSANTTTSSVPATFCQPASEVSVPVASSFTLNLEFLQDWSQADGLSAWLFKNDATEQCFELYLKGAQDPSASGTIIAQAGAFGGAPGSSLTATATLNIQGYPDIKGPSGNSLRDVNDVTVSHPTVSGTDAADLTTLQGSGTIGDGNYTGPTFTSGQYVVLGDGSKAHYTNGAWAVGPMT